MVANRGSAGGMTTVRCASRIGVAASVVMNLAFLALYIHRHYFSGGGGGGKEITTVEPSKGKPLVTPDSIVNLDQ
jgi:L-tryptophan--pyruvate aminotransferase